MASRHIYICDKCKKEQEGTVNQMWKAAVIIKPYNHKYTDNEFIGSSPHVMELCRQCAIDFGLIEVKREKTEDAPKPPSLEDMIYEIAHAAAGDAVYENR